MGGNYHLIKGNPERLKIECIRIASYQNDKYKNDEEYRERKKTYAKEYRLLKALEKKRIAEQARTETMPDLICG
jgi:hypothetical protein